MHLIKKSKVRVRIFFSQKREIEINSTPPDNWHCRLCSLDARKLGRDSADYLLVHPESELNFINRNMSALCVECSISWYSGYFSRKEDWSK